MAICVILYSNRYNTFQTLVAYTHFTSSTSMSYTGISFTLTKPACVHAYLDYNSNAPQALAIADRSSGTVTCQGLVTREGTTNMSVGRLENCVILNAGTYYIWAKYNGESDNACGVFVQY